MTATLTTFGSFVGTGAENTAISITFAELIAQGDESASVDKFKVTSVASGTLTIDSNPWAATTNDTITSSSVVTWTSGTSVVGILPAFYVVASDDNGSTYSATPVAATISVDPPAVTGSTASGNEDALITVILSATDVDGTIDHFTIKSNTLTNGTLYSDAGGTIPINASNDFNITATGGNATVYFQPTLNYNGSATFDYTATNNDTVPVTSAVAAMAITVNAVNDAPTGTDNTNITVVEDGSFTFVPATFGFSDVEDGSTLTAVKITTLPLNGTLTLNNGTTDVAVTANDVITYTDINTGKLKFTPDANENNDVRADTTQPSIYATIGFKVQDVDTALSVAENTLTFNVTPVNDVLTVDANDTAATTEAAISIAVKDGTAGDAVGATEVVTVTFPALASGQSFTLGGLTVTGIGAGAVDTAVATAFATLADGGTPVDTGTLTFTGALTHFSTAAATGAAVTFTGSSVGKYDLDETLSGLTGVASNAFAFAYTGATNTRGVDQTSGLTESADVTFVELTNGQSFTLGGLTVTASGTVTAAEVAAAFSNLSDTSAVINTAAYTGGLLTPSNALTGFSTSNVTNGTHVVFTSTTPDANVANLELTNATPAALNPTLTATGTFTASDVTDAETVSANIVSVAVTGTSALAGTFSNLQALNMLSFNASSYVNADAAVTGANGASGTTDWFFNSVGFDPASQLSDSFGQLKAGETLVFTYNIDFVDTSGAADNTVTRTVAVTVTGTNDAPIITTALPDVNVVKDEAFAYPLTDFFSDVDAGDTLTYSFTVDGAAAPAWLTLDNNDTITGGETISKLAGAIAPIGDYVIEVTATDGSGAAVKDSFVIEVTNEAVSDTDIGLALRPMLLSTVDAAGVPVADTFSGVSGVKEAVSYSQAAAGVNVTLPAADVASTIAGGMGADAVGDTFLNIDNLIGSDFNDTLTGNADDNIIYGGAGTDTIDGAGGSDTLYGGAGSDNITAGAGSDTIAGEADNDTIILSVNLSTDDTIDGGTGYDTLTFTDGNSAVTDIDHVINVELITLGDAATAVTSVNNNVAPSAILEVTAAALSAANGLTWVGSAETDGFFSITGGAGSDAITGGALGDTINGGTGGSDVISGGLGNDSITTAGDNDNISGDGGNDIINAGAGSNTIAGGAGSDQITAAAGTDSIDGGEGADVILMGANLTVADTIDGGTDSVSDVSIDTLAFTDAGGATTDINNVTNIETIILGNAVTNVVAVNGNVAASKVLNVDATAILAANTLTWDAHGAADGSYSIVAGNGSDTITGGAQSDTINGGAGSDAINGGAGTDSINGGSGDDTITLNAVDVGVGESISGGAGNDTLIVDDGTNLTQIVTNYDNLVVEASIENLVINDLNAATITLDEAINLSTLNISGVATAATTDYTLALGTLTQTNVSLANLTFASRAYGVTVNADGTTATGATSVAIAAGNTNTKFVVQLAATASTFVGSSINDSVTGGAQSDVIDGGAGSDTIIGGTGVDTINGGAGVDSLDGGLGVDSLSGGSGNDIYVVDETTDQVVELSINSSDTADLVMSSANYTLPLYVEKLTLTSGAATLATGNNLANTITGNSIGNTIDGGTGADAMIGGGGSDTYIVDNVGDTISELASEGTADLVQASVTYTISDVDVENLTLTGRLVINGTGNSSNNTITGNIAANLLNGAGGSDTLQGDAGNDTLSGGLGADILKGQGGVDRFKFESTYDADNKIDTVFDFSHALGEKIDLSSIDANSSIVSDQVFTFIGTSAFTTGAGGQGQLRYTTNGSGGSYIEGKTAATADTTTYDFRIDVTGVTTFTATDFVL